jgi:hypothetical protein
MTKGNCKEKVKKGLSKGLRVFRNGRQAGGAKWFSRREKKGFYGTGNPRWWVGAPVGGGSGLIDQHRRRSFLVANFLEMGWVGLDE